MKSKIRNINDGQRSARLQNYLNKPIVQERAGNQAGFIQLSSRKRGVEDFLSKPKGISTIKTKKKKLQRKILIMKSF